MPFDGVTYNGAQPLPPSAYHPDNGPSDVIAGALAGAYYASRKGPRLIGQQTYQVFFGQADDFDIATWQSTESVFVDVGRFKRYIPAHATRLYAEAQWLNVSFRPIIGHHRINVSGVKTGPTFSEEVDPAFEGFQDFLSAFSHTTNAWTNRRAQFMERASRTVSTCELDITSGVTLGQELTITVQGYSEDPGFAGGSYAPLYVTAWWGSDG